MSRLFMINGQVADMDDKTVINQSYKSPIFSDLQKLAANTTLTIKLPLTAHNRALIKNVNIVGVGGGFAYDYFRADYVVDGLEQIDNGIGYVLNISDSIEVSVIFGGISGFTKFKDAKLREMPIPMAQGQIEWHTAQWANFATTGDIMFLYSDFGCNFKGMQYAHPSVGVPKVIQWINEAYGMNLAPIGQGLVVPCVTKDRREGSMKPMSFYRRNIKHEEPWDDPILLLRADMIEAIAPGSFVLKRNAQGMHSYLCDTEFKLSATAVISTWTKDTNMGDIVVPGREISRETIVINKFAVRNESTDELVIYEREDDSDKDCIVDIKGNTPYSFYIGGITISDSRTQHWEESNFHIAIGGDELTFGEPFDTLHNLPDMKVVDFLKAIMQIQGVFPQFTPNGIGYVSVDDLYNNITRAKDWSDKLLEVKNLGFRFLSFGQKNTLAWAEDDTTPAVAAKAGILYVDNRTIEPSYECVKFPFAGTANLGSDTYATADVPLYKALPVTSQDEQSTVEFEKIKPRILQEIELPGGSMVARAFTMDDVVNDYYTKYQQVIRRPKVVKCTMMLTARDIAQLDLIAPIYVEQLGGHFAVMSVTTKDNGADVELLAL